MAVMSRSKLSTYNSRTCMMIRHVKHFSAQDFLDRKAILMGDSNLIGGHTSTLDHTSIAYPKITTRRELIENRVLHHLRYLILGPSQSYEREAGSIVRNP